MYEIFRDEIALINAGSGDLVGKGAVKLCGIKVGESAILDFL